MTDLETVWLPLRAHTQADALPMFCLPHAGGSASAYRGWMGKLPGVAVLPVQPPGREARLRDAPHNHMGPLVEELATVVLGVAGTRPYAVYGHSLGGLVGFELLRAIRRRGGAMPAHFFVSGCVAPHTAFDDGPPVAGMSLPQLVEMLRQLGGTPEWLLNDPSVLDMIVPAVRADFSIKETYEYVSEAPLQVPITVLSSTHDPRASHELQAGWRDQTIGACQVHTLVGGHFAVFEQPELTQKYVNAALVPILYGSPFRN
ncbi:medium-chain acyl-[acyl-carrier-protein] hydrolase [Allocatelliglobosispora scoriae]|uniref:Medium-chain acyl-[acyl-carrier-protein] hydrolase n=1 Tax=Allocatelliglobosispora scoriae TaxID=643052 RepID=A0A841BWJ7_9ACTN|nr:alpha/beta fold hydrolase [Allocatelliglobosispora scoriae]MBB5873487.1 medium-chain acyl-[acyl-carrier-protein] hydrolase [Allocatelliglobosispora scoriae]